MDERDIFIQRVFKDYISKDFSILEIGCGDGRRMRALEAIGYKVKGIDKLQGTAIEDVKPKKYDVIYTMSCLFTIPLENDWVFEKIAKMAKKYIITVEGETSKDKVIGRNYKDIFEAMGFSEIYHEQDVFNIFGHLRVLKRNG